MHCVYIRTLLGSCLILMIGSSALGQTQPGRLELLDVFNLQLATDPQISPDGKRIVYVRQFSDIMTDKRYSNLWIINSDGSNHRSLTTGNYTESSPRWSSD